MATSSRARYVSVLANTLNSSGKITSDNVLLPDSGVTAGSYGSASQVPVLTVDSKGRVTSASVTSVAGVTAYSYNTSSGRMTINTADGGSFTADVTLAPFSTTNLTEGTNQYFTTARARSSISSTGTNLSYNSTTGVLSYTQGNTDTVAEGATNLYYTDARARDALSYTTGSASYNSISGQFTIPSTTAHISEGSNLYYTDARVRAAISGGTGVTYNSTTGSFSIGQPVATTDNVNFATVTTSGDVVVGGNLTVSGTTTTVNSTTVSVADINIEVARNATTAAQANGAGLTVTGPTIPATLTYSSADNRWNLNKDLNINRVYGNLTGAVTGNASTATTLETTRSITATGDASWTVNFNGSANVSGALTLSNSGVTAGSYGSGTAIPVLTIDSKGRVTSASTAGVVIGDGALTVSAGAGLTGSGTFTANQTTNNTITLSHADTSSVTDLSGSTNTFITGQTYDTYGHVQTRTTGSVDFTVAANYAFQNAAIGADIGYTWGTANTNSTQVADSSSDTLTFVNGGAINLYTNTVAGTDAIKIEHADTSSVANLSSDNAGNTFIQDLSLTFDTYGHVTGATVATGTVSVGDGAMTVTAGAGLTGGGQVGTANQTGASSVTISHADTSSVTDRVAATNVFVSGITFDTYGHVQTITTGSPSGFLTAESDTLATVTARGNTTTTSIQASNLNPAYSVSNFDTIKAPGLYQYDGTMTSTPNGRANYRSIEIGSSGRYTQVAFPWDQAEMYFRRHTDANWSSWTRVWTADNLTNLNQLTNGPGYITGESDTLASVTARGASTSTVTSFNGGGGDGLPALRINQTSAAGSANWLGSFINSGLNAAAGKWGLILLGQAESNKNSGYLGFQWQGNSSNSNAVTLGLYAADNLLRVYGGGYTEMSGSARAPIFYDLDDTGYYLDLNSTSNTALRIRGGGLFGPNPTWGAYLYVGTNGDTDSGQAQVFSTNGNLHLEPSSSHQIYLSHYRGGYFRAYGMYDNDDTGYYLDPNSNSRLYQTFTNVSYFGVDSNKGHAQGYGTYSSQLHRIARITFDWDSNYNSENHGVFSTNSAGNYSDSMSINSYNDINLRIDSNNNDNASYVRFHMHTTGDGQFAYIGYNGSNYESYFSGITYTPDMRADIYYDRNDTGYYLNPHGVSHIYYLTVGTWANNQSYPGVIISGSTDYNYNFLNGSWSGSVTAGYLANCADQWEMAIHDSGTRVVSPLFFAGGGNHYFEMGRDIGWGTTPVIATNSFRAPIFYDSNNTATYANLSQTSGTMISTGASSDTLGYNPSYGIYIGGINGRYIYSGNSSYNGPIFHNGSSAYTIWHNGNLTAVSQLSNDVGYLAKTHSGSDFPNGTLVVTNINAAVTYGDSFVLECTGKSYSTNPAFSFIVQGYIYADTFINCSGVHNGYAGFSTMKILNYNGNLAFWWPRVSYWNSFEVRVREAGGGTGNRVTSIGDSAEPSSSKKVSVSMFTSAIYGINSNTSSLYSTILYDSDNTGYYVDPSSTTYINVLTTAGNITSNSDIRLKRNIEKIVNATDKVKKLNGVTFTRIDVEDTSKRYAGLIAQEVLEVLPEAVEGTNTYSVAYGNLVGLLVEAIKEQDDKISRLEALVETLINKLGEK